MKGLFWFRRDLRIEDNTALIEASKQCAEGLAAVFVITPETWLRHYRAPCQIALMLRQLELLSRELAKYSIPLLIKQTPHYSDCPKLLIKLMQTHGLTDLYFNKEYEYDEQRRDNLVEKECAKAELNIISFHDQVIAPPGIIRTGKNEPYKVFTPFSKAWLRWVNETGAYIADGKPRKCNASTISPDPIPKKLHGFECTIDIDPWVVGEARAKKQLIQFAHEQVADYKQQRDFPAVPGTSRLSPYLALGIISPRQCVMALLEALDTADFMTIQTRPGYATWLNELMWREFYKHILYEFPRVSRGRAFLPETEKLQWSHSEKNFKAWCEGKTGIPIVDAAMRCLVQTGWMHNRLRMIVGMFLTKNLWIDWRKGEAFFMRYLIDGDFAANNGGWQWSASTGTDAAPYFRIFNPVSQSERFDPEGKFIRQYCPELAKLDNRAIHQPTSTVIIDLKTSRQQAIAGFKKLKTSAQLV